MEEQKEFKRKNTYKYRKKEEEMAKGISIGILPIILIIAFLFLVPVIEKQYFIININGNNENAKIDSINLVIISKPLLDIFAKTNPSGNLKLEVDISNKTGWSLLNGQALNVGEGQSIFVIKDKILRGDLTINSILLYNNNNIDNKREEIHIP